MLTTHNIDIQAMLVWLTLPFCHFCGFRSVAVNTVYKLQFFYIYFIICPMLYAIAMGQITTANCKIQRINVSFVQGTNFYCIIQNWKTFLYH